MPTDIHVFKYYTCPHCRRTTPQMGSQDDRTIGCFNGAPGAAQARPVWTAEYIVCPICNNRMTALSPFSEGGGRNTTLPLDNHK